MTKTVYVLTVGMIAMAAATPAAAFGISVTTSGGFEVHIPKVAKGGVAVSGGAALGDEGVQAQVGAAAAASVGGVSVAHQAAIAAQLDIPKPDITLPKLPKL